MFERKWVERKLRLNRKVVIRLSEDLYQKLLTFLENNPKHPTISSYFRSLVVDHLTSQIVGGQNKKAEVEENGETRTETAAQGQ